MRESTDARIERVVGLVLRGGVGTSSVLLSAGLLLSFVAHGWIGGAILMTAGLLVLMGTPAARVVASIVEYAWARDWLFVVLTGLVLLEICGGVIAALVYHQRL
jgi:uncharacterized membrane protein